MISYRSFRESNVENSSAKKARLKSIKPTCNHLLKSKKLYAPR